MPADLDSLQTFVAVARARSFRVAAESLHVTASAVSQSVKQLEVRLGLQLLARTTRSVALTEAGARLYERLGPALGDVEAALESLHELRDRPAGLLRLSVSSIAESFLSTDLLPKFLHAHPEIDLDVALDDRTVDIVGEGYDAGVHLGEVIREDMVTVPASRPQRQVVVGSPAYLAAHGKPRHPRDLRHHVCIGWREVSQKHAYRWEFSEKGRDFAIEVRARVNTTEADLMHRLAVEGMGLTIGMEDQLRPLLDAGALERVLDAYCPAFPGFFLYYPSRAQTPPKLRALVDFVRAWLTAGSTQPRVPSRSTSRRASRGGRS